MHTPVLLYKVGFKGVHIRRTFQKYSDMITSCIIGPLYTFTLSPNYMSYLNSYVSYVNYSHNKTLWGGLS